MTPAYEHPSLNLLVSDEQRDRAVDWLQRAYADGRLTEVELDQRLDQVFAARTRKDLNLAFYGLVQPTASSQALGTHPAYAPLVSAQARDGAGRGIGAFSYFSALFTWIFGPLVGYLVAPMGSEAKRQAANAFDFTLLSTGGMIAGGILSEIWGPLGIIAGISALAWFLLIIVGGAKVAAGEHWENPLMKLVPIRILSKPEPRTIGR
ncbi:DUF1707 and DUF4870 domain-containing protein [Raineyella sp. W15-4]|uniref:DUF1707 and DUF4870 domain-containing protein n=1 Tax=Raineyella sp. W15-4 TaxID=3081651 RepID=UPI00295388DD|nr:DUF1707 and DUF4870 domain-containing protein [Raineyella sp. W15-4]WOQ15588.1 DUF1707 and DUF4870 domain-containing protein [Raineyella sp. W15-4]